MLLNLQWFAGLTASEKQTLAYRCGVRRPQIVAVFGG